METKEKLHDLKEHRWGCEILFATGETVFLQGEDAFNLVDEIDKCETHEQIHNILCEYEVLINE
jgi:hypothetical protein